VPENSLKIYTIYSAEGKEKFQKEGIIPGHASGSEVGTGSATEATAKVEEKSEGTDKS
jgi:hypothetical protein